MPRFLSLPDAAPARAVHAVLTGAAYKRLVVSALPGARPDGTLPEGATAQVEQAFDNLAGLITASGLTRDDVVRVAAYLAFADSEGLVAAAATARLGVLRPTLALRQVASLTQAGALIEVDAEAVREG